MDNSALIDPTRCPDHRGLATPPPCRACGDRREAHTRAKVAAAAAAKRAEAAAAAAQRQRRIDACSWCDSDGRRLGTRAAFPARCNHSAPGGRQRAERALALVGEVA